MKILVLGDVVGKPGRKAIADIVPLLRAEHNPEIVIANAENAAGGFGLTPEMAGQLLNVGVDVLTLGNHAWSKKEITEYLTIEPRVLRPANFPPGLPGRGFGVFEGASGVRIGVVNLIGRTFMVPVEDPFRTAEAIQKEIRGQTKIIIVDMHAEATSEKVAIGWYLDGRTTAVIGTHTHVQTSDERVLPQGTAYITDTGMVGPRNSVLGLRTELVIERFLTQVQGRIEVASGPYIVNGVIVEADAETGRAMSISRIVKWKADEMEVER